MCVCTHTSLCMYIYILCLYIYMYTYGGRDDANTCIEHNVSNDIGVLDRCRAATSGCHCDSSAFSLRLGHLAAGG